MKALLRQFGRDERGVTAIEYAMIAGGIAVVIVGAVASIGGTVGGVFQSVAGWF
jgi:pilus assembly protein Flp/PilA